MKILYITSGMLWKISGNSIQITDEIRALKRAGHDVDVLLMPIRSILASNREAILAFRKQLEMEGVNVLLKTIPFFRIRPFPQLILSLRAFLIHQIVKKRKYDIISAHTIWTGAACAKLRSRIPGFPRLVYDIHGAFEPEMIFNGADPESADIRIYRSWEASALKNADLVFVVSNYFKNWIQESYDTPADKIWVTPSSTIIEPLPSAEWRETKREELGIGKRPVLLYSGSMLSWQRAQDLIQLYGKLRDYIPEAFLLVLTGAPDLASKYAEACGLAKQDYAVLRVPPAEVRPMMSVGDVGCLIRHDNLLNRVASPVKFADYLGAGLPVLLSPGIGDCSEMVRATGLGIVWEETTCLLPELASALRSLLELRSDNQREACRELAQNFSWTKTMQVFEEAFTSLHNTTDI